MPMENQNYIMREITPLSERDCFYIADRRKTEFTFFTIITRLWCNL